jgi:hypothetical protein
MVLAEAPFKKLVGASIICDERSAINHNTNVIIAILKCRSDMVVCEEVSVTSRAIPDSEKNVLEALGRYEQRLD